MIKTIIKKLLNSFGWKLIKINRKLPTGYVYETPDLSNINSILNSTGILHLGAHRGKEAEVYNWFNKKVLWVEANPIIFDDLKDHIKFFYNQKAINALLGDEVKKNVDFYISNKDASCSSIFQFSKKVKDGKLWKKHQVKMLNKIKLKMLTLDRIVKRYTINIKNYNHWIIDLQGAELQTLKGAKNSLKFCKSISVEISKKDYYEKGSTKWQQLKKFLISCGFRTKYEAKKNHCDVLFLKKKNNDRTK